ncbi:hypothetical protein Salat_2815800 [Sesamum alatum]|uniref:Uncharacterized protein n=1 Tax=Sesamum alatum TaxID=300844 RepID=A0AAE1XLB3_9LAMI|nr:hypothetical protein Salat_2815800 [Sesamum alatum]
MMGCIMRSFLLILLFALVNAQARTLTEDYDKIKAKYERYLRPPPPPKSAPPTKEESPLLLPSLNNYGRYTPSPPPPKPATPVIQMISDGEENIFSTQKIHGTRGLSPPPAPKVAPPKHELSGQGSVASDRSSLSLLVSSA